MDCVSDRPVCRLRREYYTRCCINTIRPPDDEHRVARNMYRIIIINRFILGYCASSWSFTQNCTRTHGQQNMKFVGAFAESRKATISFFISVCLSVCLSVHLSAWNTSAPNVRISTKVHICIFFEKSVEKIQVSLKPDKNNGCYT